MFKISTETNVWLLIAVVAVALGAFYGGLIKWFISFFGPDIPFFPTWIAIAILLAIALTFLKLLFDAIGPT